MLPKPLGDIRGSHAPGDTGGFRDLLGDEGYLGAWVQSRASIFQVSNTFFSFSKTLFSSFFYLYTYGSPWSRSKPPCDDDGLHQRRGLTLAGESASLRSQWGWCSQSSFSKELKARVSACFHHEISRPFL